MKRYHQGIKTPESFAGGAGLEQFAIAIAIQITCKEAAYLNDSLSVPE